MVKAAIQIICIIFTVALSGCSSQSLVHKDQLDHSDNLNIPINYNLFNIEDVEVINEDEIFLLSNDQQNEFLDYFNQHTQQGFKSHRIIETFLEKRLANFTYYGETFIAEKAMRLNKGNCMSLAILTTALARLVELDYSYREVNTLPVFEKHNNLLLSSSHVQTVIYDPNFTPKKNTLYISKPSIVIDYFPNQSNRAGQKFKFKNFLSMYYRNIASDALLNDNLDLAFIYANKGFEVDSSSIPMVNFLAILHKRKGDLKTAESIYKIGLRSEKHNLALLSNYIVLLQNQERFEEADIVEQSLKELNDPNPYNWLEQAYIAQQDNDPRAAKIYYNKVLSIAPYVNEAYQGLYQIYLAEGKTRLAKTMLKKALEWTYEIKERKLYKYKLYNLNNPLPVTI